MAEGGRESYRVDSGAFYVFERCFWVNEKPVRTAEPWFYFMHGSGWCINQLDQLIRVDVQIQRRHRKHLQQNYLQLRDTLRRSPTVSLLLLRHPQLLRHRTSIHHATLIPQMRRPAHSHRGVRIILYFHLGCVDLIFLCCNYDYRVYCGIC